MKIIQPLIQQRADPFIGRHTDGYYYFTASVPAYDRIEIRRARTIAGLAAAKPVDVWHKPNEGPMTELIWAPEIHRIDGAWYVYFAAAPVAAIKDDLFQHRIYAVATTAANPLEGQWAWPGRIETGLGHLLPGCHDVRSPRCALLCLGPEGSGHPRQFQPLYRAHGIADPARHRPPCGCRDRSSTGKRAASW